MRTLRKLGVGIVLALTLSGCISAYPGSEPGTPMEYRVEVKLQEPPEGAHIIDGEDANITEKQPVEGAIAELRESDDDYNLTIVNESTLSELNATYDNYEVSREVYHKNTFSRTIFVRIDGEVYKIKIRKVGLS